MTGTLNKVMLIGHTGDDVKMHYFEGGGSIGRFPVATNESYTNRTTGERVTNTEWHNVVVRNKAAEVCEKYLKKGDRVYVEGRIKTRKWQDDQGQDKYQTEIHCSEFTFLTPKNETGMQNSGNSQGTGNNSNSKSGNSKSQSNQNESVNQQEEEDDLPF
ncbi:single-stranded DNA-binding protein [Gramella sp. AN32]|uniref:Single-stranded DNA-binding protein n=1 Tax=Christiangramia antarctica TaxID=2058158 RepID=A0ABW5WZK5_9FLAO|nr:single-stranded DNA-binding protein [Gramella sp. AN32]MCM4155248.1 single-stranded DNA-binding protein [Gramella sp. AN32]